MNSTKIILLHEHFYQRVYRGGYFFPIIVIWSKISERRSISPSGNFLETCYGILNH